LAWLISRFILTTFDLDQAIMRAVYFVGNDLFLIAFFSILLKTTFYNQLKRLYFGCLYYSIALLICDILLFAEIGDVSKWYFQLFLFILTLIGIGYGKYIDKYVAKANSDIFRSVRNIFVHR
jgi:hypothetical protein